MSGQSYSQLPDSFQFSTAAAESGSRSLSGIGVDHLLDGEPASRRKPVADAGLGLAGIPWDVASYEPSHREGYDDQADGSCGYADGSRVLHDGLLRSVAIGSVPDSIRAEPTIAQGEAATVI